MRALGTVSALAIMAIHIAVLPVQAAPAPGPKAAAAAQIAPALQLLAHDTRRDREAVADVALTISSLDIDVNISGHMAQTTIVATFSNPGERPLEGDFSLDLPTGAYVTGYGLDVGGAMIDGVLQPKLKAREAYEEQLRAGVDPGLAEVDAANRFTTHIFPILPGSGRTVKVVFVTPVGPDGRFELPLTTAGKVGRLSIRTMRPGFDVVQVSLPVAARDRKSSDAAGDIFVTRDVQVQGALILTGLKPKSEVTLSRHANGETFFEAVVAAEPAGALKARTLRLYWDASRSRREADTKAEAALIAAYVAQTRPKALDLILFNDRMPQVVHIDAPTPEAVLTALADVRYEGATRFTDLERVLDGRADACIVVSDGQMTLDAFAAKRWPCRVMTVSSDKSARRDVLRQLAARNGGAYIDMAALGPEEALKQLLVRASKLRDVTDENGQPVDYAVSAMGSDLYRIVGPKPDGSRLVLDYGDTQKTFDFGKLNTDSNDGAGTAWGAVQIERLNATDAPDAEKVLALARRYHVATPDVSFIVLETGADYARNGIEPPEAIAKSVRDEYIAVRDGLAKTAADRKAARFDDVLTMWSEQKEWWATKPVTLAWATAEIRRRKTAKTESAPAGTPLPSPMQPRVTPSSEAAPPPPASSDDRVVVTGNRAQLRYSVALKRGADIGGDGAESLGFSGGYTPQIEISTAEWNPDRPYLKALTGIKPGDKAAFEIAYRAQEAQFGDTPAFYFDTAEWMFRNGFAGGAAATARNALDLTSSDIDSQIILAGRLLRYGDDDNALWLDEHIARLTPEKPQAQRNLALALIETTDRRLAAKAISKADALKSYTRALELLSKVVLTPWNSDYDGIEIIALTEANHLVARMKTLGATADDLSDILPAKLTGLLDVDIRITLEWNTDKTDMDLWVDEPSAERAIYSNPHTLLGGRLSNDMTRGYGPEEYLLHVAPSGGYEVLANVYAADRIDPNGATSITVRLYRDWGRPTEKVESFVIELAKGQKGTVQVGKFTRK